MTIIGILAGLAVLSIGGTERRELQQEALRLNRLLDMAISEATFQHQSFGLSFYDNQYSFFILDENSRQWLHLNEAPWKSHRVPEYATVELQLDGEAPNFDLLNEDQDGRRLLPSLFILASGEITPFRLNFYLSDESNTTAYIASDGFNHPTLVLGNANGD